jgi:chromate reductase
MTPFKIAVVVGSLRKNSINKKLALALAKLAPTDVVFEPLRIDDLPLYNQDDDAQPSESVMHMKAQVAVSQGVLFLTPEYNRSIPGVLKNALDHGSRPYGKSVWNGKPAGVMGASMGPIGTAMA